MTAKAPHPHPGSLVETPWGPISTTAALPPTDPRLHDQILDAALQAFSANSIDATTMAAIAKKSPVSRAWIYHHFAGHSAIVTALITREAQRFAALLPTHNSPEPNNLGSSTAEVFIHIIEYARQYPAIIEIAERDTGTLAEAAISFLARSLTNFGSISLNHARVSAETTVRLIISILTMPLSTTDFTNAEELRSFAYLVIAPLIDP